MPTDAMRGKAALTRWLDVGGVGADITSLAGDVQAVVELARNLQDVAQSLSATAKDAPLDDPGRLATWVMAHVSDEPVAQAFAGVGLTELHGQLMERCERLGDIATLLQPVGDFETDHQGALTLKLPELDIGSDVAAASAALRFDVGTTGELSCSAAAAWPFTADGVNDRLVRIGMQGSVTTKAGLSLPFGQIGSGTAHAGAASALALSLFFDHANAERSYAEALSSALQSLPSPLSLSGLHEAAGLQGLVLGGEGSVGAGIDVTLGKSVAIPDVLSGKLGLTVGLSFERRARWVLSLRRVPEGMRFVLSRDDLRERNWSAGVDIALDASPLARRVHDLLLDARDFAGPALSQIRPFFSPGTYMATRAASLLATAAGSIVAQPAVRDALLKDPSLVLDNAPADDAKLSSAIVELVSDTIADLTSRHAHRLLDDAVQWANAIATDLIARVPPLAAVPAKDIEARLRPLLSDVINQFDGLVGSLAHDPAWATRLGEELASIGAVVRSGQVEADTLLAGTRTTLERFLGFADQVIAATADDTSAKLAAQFVWTGADASASRYELVGTFTELNPLTVSLWQALVAGRLEPFQTILADPAATPAGLTLSPDSSLSRFVSGQRGFAAQLTLLGLDISLASIVKGDATVTRNASGDIAVTAKGSALRQAEGFGEGRSASFITSTDLLLLKAGSAAASRRAVTVDIGFDHTDKNLTTAEVQAMFAGLKDQGLVASTRVDVALGIYQEWRVKAAAEGKISGRIDMRLRLPSATVDRMVAIGRRLNAHDNAAMLAVFDLAVRCQIATGVTSQKVFDRDLKTAMETYTISKKTDQPIAYLVALWKSQVDLSSDRDGSGRRLPALAQLLPRAGALVTLLRTMAQICDSVPAEREAPSQGTWSAGDYADAERRMVSASRSWLRLNQNFLFFFRASLHPALLAFLRLLVVICTSTGHDDPISGFSDPIDTALSSPLFFITMVHGDGGIAVPV